MNKAVIVFVILFGMVLANARVTDGQASFQVEKDKLTITAQKGFHLNAEAPANVSFDQNQDTFKADIKTEKQFVFKIFEKAKQAKLSFYVCDDKKTVCEQHQETVLLASGKVTASPEAQLKNKNSDVKMIQTEDVIVSANNKPTLLVFSAPWCPACIRMQTETYSKAQVAEQIKKINFKKLNSDLAENFDIAEKFHVHAIPTLILLNSSGEEVYRWLDFQKPNEFAKSLAFQLKSQNNSVSKLQELASTGDEPAISQLGMMAYNATNCSDAVKWFSLSKKVQDMKYKLAAEVACAQEAFDKDEKKADPYFQSLQKAITLSTSEMDQLRWTVDLIDKKNELKTLNQETKEIALKTILKLDDILKNKALPVKLFSESTYGEISGFEKVEILYMKSRLLTAIEDQRGKEKNDLQIIQELKAKKLSTSRPGEMLLVISYLKEAGETNDVEKMYQNLIEKYPQTYVYYEKYSRFLLKQKKSLEALAQSEKALQFSEGNQPQLYLLKVKVLKELQQKEKALKTIQQALNLKEIEHTKFKNTLTQLNKLKEEMIK